MAPPDVKRGPRNDCPAQTVTLVNADGSPITIGIFTQEGALEAAAWVISSTTPDPKSMAADFATPNLNVLQFNFCGVEIVWTGADATDGTIELQGSITGNAGTFNRIGGQIRVVDQTGDTQILVARPVDYKFIRLEFIANSNTAGTMEFRYLVKSL